MTRPVGYYVHHHGAGHLHRFLAVRSRLPGLVGLSSLPRPAEVAAEDWIALPLDTDGSAPADPTADGALHWAPLGIRGLRERTARIAAWAAASDPAVLVTDVSVEVALTARLLSVPTVVIAQYGDRRDEPHTLAYRTASAVATLWPASVGLVAHGARAERVHAVGPISRFDDRACPAPPPVAASGGGPNRVLLLGGAGGSHWNRDAIDGARRATARRWVWQLAGEAAGGPALGPEAIWDALASADVVVAPASMNCVAEVAAAGRRLIVLPQSRPFGEQTAHAGVLAALGLATVLPAWPRAEQWPGLLADALARPAPDWASYHDRHGAARLAELVETVAAR